MRVLCHFENIERKASQLRSMIEGLKRGVLLLEADIAAVEKFDQQADPTKSAYPIAARTMKARRENLIRTILTLQGKLNDAELSQFSRSASLNGAHAHQIEQVHNE